MGTTYLTDGDDLTSVANAIRAKSGGSSQLAFPAGFVSEIQAIPSGGATEVKISDSGAVAQALDPDKIYHFTGDLISLTITLNGALSDTYQFDFASGATPPTLLIPSNVVIPHDFIVMKRCKTIISITNNVLSWMPEAVLQSAYTKVQCIHIPAGGFVNTGIIPNGASKISAVMRLDENIPTMPEAAMILFGCRTGTNVFAQVGYYKSTGDGVIFQFGTNTSYYSLGTKDNNKHNYYVLGKMAEIAIDNTVDFRGNTSGLPNAPMIIGARQTQDGTGYERFADLTVWSYSQRVGADYVINLVPCKRNSDSEYGFYDTVSDTFFGNSGSGAFEEGVE